MVLEDILAIRQGCWQRENAQGFLSRLGIEVIFEDSEYIVFEETNEILIGFWTNAYGEESRNSAELTMSGNRVHVGSNVTKNPIDILAALLGKYRSTISPELNQEIMTLLAEYTSQNFLIKEYNKMETEINYGSELDYEHTYKVRSRSLSSLNIKGQKRPSLLCVKEYRFENDYRATRWSNPSELRIIFEDGNTEKLEEKD